MKLPKPVPPNDAGVTNCNVRWIMETDHGWIGAWDKEAITKLLEEAYKEGHEAALNGARNTSGLVSLHDSIGEVYINPSSIVRVRPFETALYKTIVTFPGEVDLAVVEPLEVVLQRIAATR